MNESFLELFSDASATPRPEFVSELESKLQGIVSPRPIKWHKKVTRRQIIVAVSIVALIALVVAVVLLPRRNLSDPVKDSVIETAVTTAQDTATGFSAEPETPLNNSSTPEPTQQKPESIDSSSTSTTEPMSAPPALESSEVSGFTTEYWNVPEDETPLIPNTPAIHSQTIGNIQLNWGAGSPHPSINPDNFMARITKSAALPAGQYRVDFSANDGISMIVNENVIFDHWFDGVGSGTAYFSTDPTLPNTTIQIDYLELSGNANITVTIQKI